MSKTNALVTPPPKKAEMIFSFVTAKKLSYLSIVCRENIIGSNAQLGIPLTILRFLSFPQPHR
jgi:hypothetical protein